MARTTPLYILCLLLGAATLSAYELFVSPAGNDAWSGLIAEPNSDSSDGPFETLTKAQNTLRQMKTQNSLPTETVYVTIREGNYRLQETWSFGEEDSGRSKAYPTVYRAYNGEKVRVLGSLPLSGWSAANNTRIPAASKTYQVCGDQVSDIYAANSNMPFHSLFVEGNRAVRAKIPNSGYLYWDVSFTDPVLDVWNFDGRQGFYYRNEDLNPDWLNIQDINIVYFYAWTTEWNYIKSINPENHTMYFNTPAGAVPGSFSRSKRYYVENVLEGLDQPREWYFDKTSMCVYYYPAAWEDMESISVEAPIVQVLLSINGSSHLRFEGLHFENADWQIYASDNVYFASGQAAAITDKIRGCINVANTDDITFEKLTITNIGVYGVFIDNSIDFHIRNSHLYDLGAGGVWIRDGVTNSEVYNNYIHGGGHVFEAAVGILVHRSSDIQIHNNEVADFKYTGISVGWTWGHGINATSNISIAYNSVHLIGQMVLSDLGGIYTLGQQPNTIVKNNHLYQIQGYVGTAFGSYSDEGSSFIVVSENLIHGANSGAMLIHYGALIEARNNVLVPGGEGMAFHMPKSKTDDFDWTIDKNIIVPTGDPVYRVYPTDWSTDSNLFLNVGCEILFDDYGNNFEQWQANSGKDSNSRWVEFDGSNIDSIIAGDLASLPAAEIAALGITLPDVGAMGLRSDMAPLAKEFPVEACRALEDFTFDMEMHNEGDDFSGLMERAVVGKNPGDIVDFSGDRSSPSSGSRSLKFTAAAGLYAPWMYMLGPGFTEGRIVFAFDAYFDTNNTGVWVFRNSRLGPNLVIINQEMQIHGKTVDVVPAQTWFRFTISHVLGVGNYSYTMQDLTNNGSVKEYWVADAPVCGSHVWRFAPLNAIGDSIYIDNIHFGAVAPRVSVAPAGENAVTVSYSDDHVAVCGLEVYVDDGLFKRIFPGAELRGKSGQVTVQLDGVKPGSRQVRAVVKTDNAHGQSSAVTVQVVPPPAGDKTPSERPLVVISSGCGASLSAALVALVVLV